MRHLQLFKITLLSFFMILLCLALVGWQTPARQQQYWYGSLVLQPGRGANQRYYCAGAQLSLGYIVKTDADELSRPVAEAMVTVKDHQGNVRATATNQAGFAIIPWQAKDPGYLRLTVTATKTDYTAAKPLEMALNVIECEWMLKVSFQEEYSIVNEFGLVVGATTDWRGSLKAEPDAEGLYNKITLQGGSGNYQFYSADQLIPYHFSLTPDISGDWNLRIEGKADYQGVHLELYTEPVSYPQMLKFDVDDVINESIQILYQPPVATSNGNGLFLDFNKLSSVTFPSTGGTISLDSGMSCYFYYPERSKYSLVLMLYNIRGPQY